MLVVNRFRVGGPEGDGPDAHGRDAHDGVDAAAEGFLDRAREALAAFAECRGFVNGRLGRAADDPSWWCLITRWESVGSYRRALGSFRVKVAATPLLAEAIEESSAYEVLAYTDGGQVRTGSSDRAPGGSAR